MVCVPCLILPVILAIYLKFIQPYVLRLVPESWRAKFDSILYPTCPIRNQMPQTNTSEQPAASVKSEEGAQTDKKTD